MEKEVTFDIPDSIKPTEINGILNRWIRVRIASGNYGEPGKYVPNEIPLPDSTDKYIVYRYEFPKYTPPFLNSLNIGYKNTVDKSKIQCKLYNKFAFEDVDLSSDFFEPFKVGWDEPPIFYIGFELVPAGEPATLFFSLKESTAEEEGRIAIPNNGGKYDSIHKADSLDWEYFNGKDWQELKVKDETEFFTKSGIISFIFPSDLTKKEEFGKKLFWIRVRLEGGKWYSPPALYGIFPNVVYAENATWVKEELLGSSNGEQNQSFEFSKKKILPGQLIEIREPGHPTKEEIAAIESEVGADAIRLKKDLKGDVKEVWVRWREVGSFIHSMTNSRHYVVDRSAGRIIFSDGLNGMIPPALPNNIVAKGYKSGGGTGGNRKENSITKLKTSIPNVESVTNPVPSVGGKDLEKIDDIFKRAPFSIKNRGKAVTPEDFENIGEDSSPDVAKVKAYTDGSSINVIVVPRYEDEAPSPPSSLLDYVESHIKERSFIGIKDRISTVQPSYEEINVNVEFVPIEITEGGLVANRIIEKLKRYLHPLHGGEYGTGWGFGQDIFISEIATLIEDVKGVDYINRLEVTKEETESKEEEKKEVFVNRIEIGINSLPSAGDIKAKPV